MKTAPVLANDQERLRTLLAYRVLDSEPEPEFDDIVEIASEICGMPIALISLVDENRQWFKARRGLDATETPRDISFCGHAIANKKLFIVNDALVDHRFSDNPLVTGELKVRFYAGAPLVSPEGYAIGTLCVMDHDERSLSEGQSHALQALARQVVNQLESRKARRELTEQFAELQVLTRTVTEQQARLAHATRMNALGEMSAGIAHEINNPLAVIMGHVQRLQRLNSVEGAVKNESVTGSLATIERTVERAAAIVKSLLLFARSSGTTRREATPTAFVVETTLALIREQIRSKGVELRLAPVPDVTLECSPVLVSQALLNLLRNALDAVVMSETKWVELSFELTADSLTLRVRDGGAGVPFERRETIFEPFFTTKPIGEGTGLGLSVSKGIIEAQGGRLALETNDAHTCFALTVPRMREVKAA